MARKESKKSSKVPAADKVTSATNTALHSPKNLGTPPSEMGLRRPDTPRDDLAPRGK
jgi:hypothetical protein